MVKLNNKKRQEFLGSEVELTGGHPHEGKKGIYIEERPLFADRKLYPVVEIKTKKGSIKTSIIKSSYWKLSNTN